MTTYTALLTRAEEAQDDTERDALDAQAEALVIKQTVAQPLSKAGKIVSRATVHTGDYAVVAGLFYAEVAEALHTLRVLQNRSGRTLRVYLIGHEADVDRADILIRSLYAQAMAATYRWWQASPSRGKLSAWEGYLARREYIQNYGRLVGQRIRQEVRDNAGDKLSALLDRSASVGTWTPPHFQSRYHAATQAPARRPTNRRTS